MQTEFISSLLNLERDLRHAESDVTKRFIIVNKTRTLLKYEQSALLEKSMGRLGYRVTSIGNLSDFEDNLPFCRWVAGVARRAMKKHGDKNVICITAEDAAGKYQKQWADFAFEHAMIILLKDPVKGMQGILWLSRPEPWTEAELNVCGFFSEIFGYALNKQGRKHLSVERIFSFVFSYKLILLACVAGFMTIPVTLSVMAPAEIVPDEPYIVTAPMDGVIADLNVQNNQKVQRGDELVLFDSTELRNQMNIASQALSVANAEYSSTKRSGFVDMSQNYKLPELQAQSAVKNAELRFARDKLKKSLVFAKTGGVAIIDDAEKWKGKPVMVGEKIMMIADPARIKLQIMVPVKDAVGIKAKSPAELYLYTDPMHPISARITKSSFAPEYGANNVLSYKVSAALIGLKKPLRIGLTGLVKIESRKVSMFYYLFRRPITSFRQWAGI